ncbi:MAG: T9SS type A sorting domain-containing protein [Bacteroidales bacterium]|nr:T9SS type A sorting domain-containing protein [Bacteroidales bacterium]
MMKSVLNLCFLVFAIIASLSVYSQSYTFSSAGATGNIGPTQFMVDTAYAGTNLDSAVDVLGGIQYWVVPSTGNYSIEAYGGQGYGDFGGRGAYIYGEFFLIGGDTLKILVGQKGGHYLDYPSTTYNHQYGGGGGSFITTLSNNPLVIAGGGGGNHGTSWVTSCDGQLTNNGAAGANASTIGAGGTGGMGGLQASSADGGGGLLGNGDGLSGGQAFINGGLGGIDEGTGGFGAGGGTSSWNNYRGGGGGGYSGGGGGNNSGNCCPCGGGGGSYNAGINRDSLAGVQIGDGLVVITSLCTPISLVADSASLPDLTDECMVSMPVSPTASNNCGSTVNGVADVVFPITNQGLTVVTWTFNDGLNTITQTQNVILSDITAPVPDSVSLPDTSYWCSIDSLIWPTATDNCSGVTVTNNVSLPIFTSGLTLVTWTFTDSVGNFSTQNQNIYLDVLDNGVIINGNTLSATGTGYQYQWLDCGNGMLPLSGENSQSFTPSDTAYYAVQLTHNGCVDTSICISVNSTSISDLSNEVFMIYPNPSSGKFIILINGEIEYIDIIDISGRSVQYYVNPVSNEVDATALENGIYTLRVKTADKLYIRQIILSK